MNKGIYDKIDEVCKAFDEAIKQIRVDIEKRRQEQQKPKPTRLVADEIVRVYTVEITYIERGDPAFCIPAKELNEQLKRRYMNIAEASLGKMLWENGSEPDDVQCVRLQQFITKAHEEQE